MRTALLLVLAASLAFAGCTRAQGDPAFDAKVRAYLLEHPEILEEMVARLEAKKQAAGQVKLTAALASNRAALERDPRDFVANPGGRITLTEFYDYRCAHCINSAPAVLEIVRANPDVRVVFKELPIFGAVSERAAGAALAVKRAGGDYLGVWRAFMAAKPLDAAAMDRILREHKVDPALIEASAADSRKHLADVQALAVKLGIEGTPAFIVGDTLVPGEDMDAVRAAIAAERKKAKG